MATPLIAQKPAPPDLEGIWSFSTLTPVERPAGVTGSFFTDAEAAAYEKRTLEGGDRDRRDGGAAVDVARAVNDYWFERGTRVSTVNGRKPSSMVIDPPDGRIPAQTAEARAKAAARQAENRAHPADGPENRSLQERCLSFNAGPPIQPGPYNNYVQILQFRDHAIIFTEMIHDARIVPLDGRPHRSPAIQQWLGDSVGHYDGATLVVDTTNLNDKANVHGAGLHLVERFTRADANTLLYQYTIDDPATYTKPWTAVLPMTRTEDRIFEYACHEGNHALVDILRGARYQEKSGTPDR
jgi:hypothetical protein